MEERSTPSTQFVPVSGEVEIIKTETKDESPTWIRTQATLTNFSALCLLLSLGFPVVSHALYILFRLIFGNLYPAYCSYKAVKTKNVKEYVRWMMYWIVFALFTCAETVTDVFFSFWFPFYYEFKIVVVIWLFSPATRGSSILYSKFVHPLFAKKEQEIDEYINRAKEQSYTTVVQLGAKGVNIATQFIMQTALKGGGEIMSHLRRTQSLGDMANRGEDVNRNRKALPIIADILREESEPVYLDATDNSDYYTYENKTDIYFPEVDIPKKRVGRPKGRGTDFSHIRSSEDISFTEDDSEGIYDSSEGTTLLSPLSRTASMGSSRQRPVPTGSGVLTSSPGQRKGSFKEDVSYVGVPVPIMMGWLGQDGQLPDTNSPQSQSFLQSAYQAFMSPQRMFRSTQQSNTNISDFIAQVDQDLLGPSIQTQLDSSLPYSNEPTQKRDTETSGITDISDISNIGTNKSDLSTGRDTSDTDTLDIRNVEVFKPITSPVIISIKTPSLSSCIVTADDYKDDSSGESTESDTLKDVPTETLTIGTLHDKSKSVENICDTKTLERTDPAFKSEKDIHVSTSLVRNTRVKSSLEKLAMATVHTVAASTLFTDMPTQSSTPSPSSSTPSPSPSPQPPPSPKRGLKLRWFKTKHAPSPPPPLPPKPKQK